MNTFDLIILLILGFFCVKGLFRGMVLEVFTLIGLLAGYLVALRVKSDLTVFIQKWIQLPDIVINTVSFLLILMVIVILFRFIAGRIRQIFKWTFLGWVDKGGGLLIGLLKGGLIASLLVLLISLIPLSQKVNKEQEKSLLFSPVRSIAPAVFNIIKTAFPKTENFYHEVKQGLTTESQKAVDDIVSKQIESLKEKNSEKIFRDSNSRQDYIEKNPEQK
ncbi:MAG: CvpA family protein [bacterium]